MFEIKYFPGNLFVNSYVATVASVPGNILGAVAYAYFGFRVTIVLSLLTGGLGALLILLLQDSSIFFVFVLLAKFGIVAAFNVIYIAHTDLFPVLFAATAMGICNTVARIGTIGAPNLAEVHGPMPLIICSSLCLTGALASLFIKPGLKDIYMNKPAPGSDKSNKEVKNEEI